MRLIIGGLKLPEVLSYKIERQNFDTTRRTVSGRMITKLSPSMKWKITIEFEDVTLSPAFQKQFYEKCMEMRVTSATVVFDNPYTGEETTAVMRCVSQKTPSSVHVVKGKISLYKNIGAVFEEV